MNNISPRRYCLKESNDIAHTATSPVKDADLGLHWPLKWVGQCSCWHSLLQYRTALQIGQGHVFFSFSQFLQCESQLSSSSSNVGGLFPAPPAVPYSLPPLFDGSFFVPLFVITIPLSGTVFLWLNFFLYTRIASPTKSTTTITASITARAIVPPLIPPLPLPESEGSGLYGIVWGQDYIWYGVNNFALAVQ